jgi:hypothetical protein
MSRPSKMKSALCGHGKCQVCGGCHNPDCKRTVRPLNACFNQLLTPEPSQWKERFDSAFPALKDLIETQPIRRINVAVELKAFISREKAKSYEEAVEEMKAAVETANIAPDRVGTFKEGHDTLKAQILYLLRSKLDPRK